MTKTMPIVMHDWEISRILSGQLIEFRRPMDPQPDWPDKHPLIIGPRVKCRNGVAGMYAAGGAVMQEFGVVECPFGKPLDHLWVRETYGSPDREKPIRGELLWYRADATYKPMFGWHARSRMPRWASRISLQIADIQVDRLYHITPQEAHRAGMPFLPISSDDYTSLLEKWYARRFPQSSSPWCWVIQIAQSTFHQHRRERKASGPCH